MSDSFPGVDYGEQLVARDRASGLRRKELAMRAGSAGSRLDDSVLCGRHASAPARVARKRVVAVGRVGR
jgi:hypothetical protein